MQVRQARPDDAPAMASVLRRSIIELCALDHRNDAEVLAGWLRNKTPAAILDMMAGQYFAVAVDESIAGVGSANADGEITLNYVSPDFRFRGVSKAILHHLENRLASTGSATVTLTSTATAHRFYLACGYADDAPPRLWRGSLAYPMRKRLGAV